ncbi:osteoclast fusion [Porites harrisoni]
MSLTRVQDVSVHDIHKRKKPRKHYVYVIHVQWQDGPIIPVYRSYDTLLELQEQLLQNGKEEDISTITLKGKRLSDWFTIKKRAKAIRRLPVVEEFLKGVVHLPLHISGSDAVITFFLPLPEDLIEIDHEEKEMHQSIDDLKRGSQKPKHRYIHHISEPMLVEQYVVICDYVKQDESDISLKSGNVVDVIEKYEHGWWFVDLDGEVGWAPASYLEPRDGSEDDQVLEVFKEGEEETYITMAGYEPQLEDEVNFDMGKIVKVIQKNLDGWWLIKFDDQEGWAPSMFMREIATSRYKEREKGKHNARALLRDHTRKYITSGRRKTWKPPQRKRSVRTNPGHGTNQTGSTGSAATPTYVNLKFHEATKSEVPGKGRTRGKLDPNEVRASARLQPIDDMKNNTEDTYENSIELSKPRPLSLVTEEAPETVSRGTSPIPSPLLVHQDSNTSSTSASDDVFHPIPSSEFPFTGTSDNAPFMADNKEPEPESNPAHEINDSENEAVKDNQDTSDEDEGDEYTENMPELVNNRRFYAMGSYKKQDEEEVNLRENAEVEVLEEDSGGWWLVRTSSHSVGWAPSNFLEKVQSLSRVEDNSDEDELPVENDYHDNLPTRPPKSPRVQKMARDMCIEKNFWNYIRKGKDMETCPIDPQEIMSESSSEVDTGNYQPAVEAKGNESEVMVFTFEDYECDPDSGVCFRKGRKKDAMKYFSSNKIVAHDNNMNILEENNNVMERSESVPSLAEPEDFDDHDYEFIGL